MSEPSASSRSSTLRERLTPLANTISSVFKRDKNKPQPVSTETPNELAKTEFEKVSASSSKEKVVMSESLQNQGRIVVVKPATGEQGPSQPYKSKFLEHL